MADAVIQEPRDEDDHSVASAVRNADDGVDCPNSIMQSLQDSCTVLRFRRLPDDEVDRPPSTCVIYNVVQHMAAGRDGQPGDAAVTSASRRSNRNQQVRRRASVAGADGVNTSEDGSGEDMCRICLEGQSEGTRNKLITPCWCDGQ